MDALLPPTNDDNPDPGYVLPPKKTEITPVSGAVNAADLIREKVAKIYENEPEAKKELAEARTAKPRSKHQQFMHELSSSGKSLAEIQTAWHNYYIALPDTEKHQVWHEFYASNTAASQYSHFVGAGSGHTQQLAAQKHQVAAPPKAQAHRQSRATKTTTELRASIRNKITAGGKLKTKHHVQSLLFGLGMGFIVVVIFLFGFFNELFLTPFIQPSRHASSAQLIINPTSVPPTTDPEVIIPKINVEIPVDYTQTSTQESVIEDALKSGIVHYPNTSLPGQNGNAAFFGHSSNNIFNPGKYKFAFVLLHELVPGDTFYLTNNGKVYVYKVFSKTVVDPSDVSVLDPVEGHPATATLITCDPPGTSLHRLIIVGDQISPDPAANTSGSTTISSDSVDSIAGNGPTLWARWWQTNYGKTVTVILAVMLVLWLARSLSRKPIAIGQPA